MTKAGYGDNQSPPSTTTPTSITSTNYYQSQPTFTTINDQSSTTPAVDLTITKPQQVELVIGLPSI